MIPNIKKYKLNVHFVQHQVFYTPIYLCADDKTVGDGLGYDLKYVLSYTDPTTNDPSDKVLVNHLFQNTNNNPNEIDIYITGGPHISNYVRNNPNCMKGEVLLWTTVVDRLPVLLLMSKKHGKRDYAEYSLRNIMESPPEKIYSPPKDTTLHYFLSQYYDRTSFQQVYFNNKTEDDKKIIEYFQKHNSIFDTKLFPVNFSEISTLLHENAGTYGYGLAADNSLRNFKMISAPMEIIPFTCIFTKKEVWEDEKKREFLHGFCRAVNLNISKIHRFNKYYHKKQQTNKYETLPLETAIKVYINDSVYSNQEELEDLKQLFVSNLKHLVKQRIFAVNLQHDLELKAIGEGITYDKDIEDILYNWIIKDIVKIEPTISDLDNERKLKVESFKAGVSNSTYNLGHFLKNRLTASKKNLTNQLERLKDNTGTNEALRELIFSAIRDVERGESIGKMLNLISLLKYDDNDSVFAHFAGLKKDAYSEYINTETPYNFARGVNSILLYLRSKGWDIVLLGMDEIENLSVSSINSDASMVFRPKSFFYDEILLELFMNACNHSSFKDPQKRILVIAFDKAENGIVIKNEIDLDKFKKIHAVLNQVNKQWMDLFFSTGLFNYHQFLRLTKTGKIMARVYKENKKLFFEVLLTLTGLNNEI